MKFKSTRGGVSGVSFENAVLCGCPEDGGLFIPEELPTLTRDQLKKLAGLSYPQLVENLLCLFIDEEEISNREIKGWILAMKKT